jgi:acyl carrier protein
LDDQVKIRGFRVEPGEVQGVLLSHPGVAEAVVVAREDVPGDRRLVGYVVPDSSSLAEPDLATALLAFVRRLLPEFLVPSTVVMMSALPLSPSGKLDREALPAPEASRRSTRRVLPRTPLEAEVCDVISGVLGGRPVGPLDGFFSDLGGHSLLATQVISRLCAVFGVALPLRSLFDTPTAAGVAAAIEDLVIAEVDALDDAEVLRRTVDRNDQ